MTHDVRKNLDWDSLRKMIEQWRTVAPYYLGDYYPLTPYSLKTDVWLAWQFDCPEEGEGVVQVFRRAENDKTDQVRTFQLRGLAPQAPYELVNFNVPGKICMSGQDLLEKGLLIHISDQPGAVVIRYKKIQ
jgi:alpha-galactosidase